MNAKELLEAKGIKDTLYNDGAWTKGGLSDLMEEYANEQVKTCNKPVVSSLLIAWEQFKKANWWESDAIDVEKVLMERFAAIYNC